MKVQASPYEPTAHAAKLAPLAIPRARDYYRGRLLGAPGIRLSRHARIVRAIADAIIADATAKYAGG